MRSVGEKGCVCVGVYGCLLAMRDCFWWKECEGLVLAGGKGRRSGHRWTGSPASEANQRLSTEQMGQRMASTSIVESKLPTRLRPCFHLGRSRLPSPTRLLMMSYRIVQN